MVDSHSARLARQILQTEVVFGVTEIPKPQNTTSLRSVALKSLNLDSKKEMLAALKEEFKECSLCSLSQTRTKLVFGNGNPNARLLFVGEAPGFDEDKQGLPFVGAAGQLLTKIIQAMKLTREDVYIANCLKCRPPENRSPLPSEIVTCNPILRRQIDIISPVVICTLGKFATQTILNIQDS